MQSLNFNMKFLTPNDVIRKLLIRKRRWLFGPPTYTILGEEKQFGILRFNFHDVTIEYNLYLYDKEQIHNIVSHALANYKSIILNLIENQTVPASALF